MTRDAGHGQGVRRVGPAVRMRRAEGGIGLRRAGTIRTTAVTKMCWVRRAEFGVRNAGARRRSSAATNRHVPWSRGQRLGLLKSGRAKLGSAEVPLSRLRQEAGPSEPRPRRPEWFNWSSGSDFDLSLALGIAILRWTIPADSPACGGPAGRQRHIRRCRPLSVDVTEARNQTANFNGSQKMVV